MRVHERDDGRKGCCDQKVLLLSTIVEKGT